MLTGEKPKALLTADVLKAAFPELDPSETDPSEIECQAHVILQGFEPRWIILGDPHKALGVLRSWNPWTASSRLRWSVVKLAAASRVLPRIPGVVNCVSRISSSYWHHHIPGFSESWSAVIHVGTPSDTRKAIVFFIGDDGVIQCAAKSPLVEGAASAIINEATILESLRGIGQFPKVIALDTGRAIAAQTWLEGKPVSRGFAQAHLDLLSLLVSPDKIVRVTDFREQARAELQVSDLPFDRVTIERALEFLNFDEPLQSFTEHRDFAPWNLKWLQDGTLGLLDWEWSVLDGLPWQDICRFFYLDDVHFNGPGNVWEIMKSSEYLLRYRQRFEIRFEALPALTMRYLLHALAADWKCGNERLSRYSFAQVERLIKMQPTSVSFSQQVHPPAVTL